MPARRNPVVRSAAILRKGGVHTQSASGVRRQRKLDLCDEIDEWLEERRESAQLKNREQEQGRSDAPEGAYACTTLRLRAPFVPVALAV